MQDHWAGLTVFVEHPEVPMDNNEAERRQRGPVVARGRTSIWFGIAVEWTLGGHVVLAVFQTLQDMGCMDSGKWLTAYLTACAKAGGTTPPDPKLYLPWNMTPQQPRTVERGETGNRPTPTRPTPMQAERRTGMTSRPISGSLGRLP